MPEPQEFPLVLPHQSSVAVLRRNGDGFLIESAPRWLTSSTGIDHVFPMTVDGNHPLRPLATIAADVARWRQPLEDYLMEIEDEAGNPFVVLMRGRHEENLPGPVRDGKDSGGVLLGMRDVTEIVRSRRRAAAIGAFHGLIGQSLPMLALYHKIAVYGPTEAPVLITGETGSGKELVARAMHERSKRSGNSFVAVNCSALTPELFESELFGHEKGSFTGAYRQHKGRFERADGGTLFLDEIGDMPSMTQSKMLRALEEGVIERVGGEREQQVDVRIVAATNIPLEQAVQMRRFRPDLYHRLSVLRLHVPPLREREGDIPVLVDYYLEIFNRRHEKQIKRLTPEAMNVLAEYHWPGNVRELRNVIERLVIESAGDAIGVRALQQWREEREYFMPGGWNVDAYYDQRTPIYAESDHFPASAAPPPAAYWEPRRPGREFPPPPEIVEARTLSYTPAPPPAPQEEEPVELTRETIEDAYHKAKGNLSKAARQLGVHKATLYRHMKKLGLSREDFES